MSLDVYLDNASATLPGIETTNTAEGDTCVLDSRPSAATMERKDVFSANITHGLWKMAHAAGIYHHIWHPEAIGVEKARDLIEPLATGLERLQAAPEVFRAYNPRNGRGTHDELVSFVSDYIGACRRQPAATVRACR